MAEEIKLPELGEDIDSGQVTRVLVQPGDAVELEQSVIELETDKATVEVPATAAGTVSDVRVEEGDEIEVGAVILTVEAAEEGAAEPAQEEQPSAEEEEETEQEAVAEAAEEEPEAEAPVEEEEAEEEPEAEEHVGEEPEEEEQPETAEAQKAAAAPVHAAPSVRRFAREQGVDISDVPPGRGGRVSREDVERFLQGREEEPHRAESTAVESPALPDFEKWGPVRRESRGAVRRRTAEHMSLCWSLIPQVTQHDVADITATEKARKQLAAEAEEAGVRLTITSIAVKVSAAALGRFPRFNASLDPEADEIIYKDYRHVGVAVATERGLLVPVLRDADRKGLLQIARELAELAEKARDGSIEPQEMKGGTFTITNVGGIGGTHFTPIVNWPQVAILGMGRAYEDSSGRMLLPLSLSYDHRVIDGAEGAEFVHWVAQALEAPLALLTEG
ncbi:MAG: 2-oxo acid dehydrogenase subunit E2 [Candidatus Brocadiia bacterium]